MPHRSTSDTAVPLRVLSEADVAALETVELPAAWPAPPHDRGVFRSRSGPDGYRTHDVYASSGRHVLRIEVAEDFVGPSDVRTLRAWLDEKDPTGLRVERVG